MNDKAEERRLEAEFRNIQRLAQQAQVAQQQEGIGEATSCPQS